MALSDRINDKLDQWRQNINTGVAGFMVTVVGKGIEMVLDIVGKAMKPAMMPMIDKLLATPDVSPEVKAILTQLKTTDGQWQATLLGGMGISAAGGTSSAVLGPVFEKINQQISRAVEQFVFDYPLVLSAHLRGVEFPYDIFDDLRKRGYSEHHIETLKKLLWLRLDPPTVQQIWLRDKPAYEKFWKDLHDIGWDDDRIKAWKELAMIIPGAQDLIRMAVREVFTPEIAEKYGQFDDFPKDFAKWGEKIGLSGEWAKNYWGAHWDLPSAGQGFEMLHRGIISHDELKVLLRALDVMPFWRDRLIKMAYSPYTRVDVRRMYKLGILDRAGVKKTYLDLGYDDEHAENLTEFTIAYYAQPIQDEADLEDVDNAANRDLTRADISDGYKRGMLARDEATTYLAALGYNPAQIDFYLDKEDLKSTQELRDAYTGNYHDLYVTGIIEDDDVKSALTTLGLASAEVDQLLKLWYIERVRRTERPTRTDLARFLKNEIITEDRWKVEMAKLGWSDEYIDWYLQDMAT